MQHRRILGRKAIQLPNQEPRQLTFRDIQTDIV